MAQIVWHEKAQELLRLHLGIARLEFGSSTMNRWVSQIHSIEKRLRSFPESYSPEPLLSHKKQMYRGAHFMKRFELVYTYDRFKDIVYVVSIWDNRMNPEILKNAID
ncbi:MAG: type II toxin-antitoxin system RelE/ParE family toxin [Prevotella sp.]|nr:type II toxin-antitoxin system RelE/ParE family toxin [Prevotella sp.]